MATFLRLLRESCESALDDGGAYAVSTATSTTVVLPALINATTNASANLYDGAWVYIASGASAGQQRKVRPGGYAPSTGTLTVYPNWTVNPTGGEIAEITHLFPAKTTPTVAEVGGEDASYQTLLNRALGMLAYPREVELAIGTHWSYPLASLPWLDRPERLLAVREPGPTGGQSVPCDWRGVKLVAIGPVPRLELGVPFEEASGTLLLETLAPADTLIAIDGVWAQSSEGLVNDDDETVVDESDVLPAFLHVAYAALAGRSPGRPYPKASELADYWLGVARRSRYWDRTNDVAGQQPSTEPAA